MTDPASEALPRLRQLIEQWNNQASLLEQSAEIHRARSSMGLAQPFKVAARELRNCVRQLEELLLSAGGSAPLPAISEEDAWIRIAAEDATDARERERQAWEAGFKLCRSYGDNHAHFDGEQKERQWQAYLAAAGGSAPRVPAACINCGEAHDGGFLSGREGQINEGAVGPFCSQCWDFLRETFQPSAPRVEPLTPMHSRHPYDEEGTEYYPETCRHQGERPMICQACVLMGIRHLVEQFKGTDVPSGGGPQP